MSRLRSYGVPVGVAVLGTVVGLLSPGFPFEGLLTTLVVAQSSLLAIVISVSLLSVQTSQFAPLLSGLYRESTFERIFARFGVSILADVVLLAAAGSPGPALRMVTLGLALGLAAWSFVSLFEIEDRMTAFLNPEPVLDDLVSETSYERYREFARSHREQGHVSRNPMLEIVQVAQTALDARDNYGALRAVAALERSTGRILDGFAESGDGDPETLHELFDYWDQLGRTAVDHGGDDVLHEVVEAEAAVARRAIDLGLHSTCGSTTRTLAAFCERAIAADRMERDYVDGLGSVLEAAVDDGDPATVAAVAGSADALREAVEHREAVERRGPSAAHLLVALAVAILEAQRRLVETDPDRLVEEPAARAYRTLEDAADECIADLLVTDADLTPVGEALTEVGVVAARADHQWVVRRIATRIIDLQAAAEDRYDGANDHVERIHEAGGEDGVETAFDYVRSIYGQGQPPEPDDPVSRLE